MRLCPTCKIFIQYIINLLLILTVTVAHYIVLVNVLVQQNITGCMCMSQSGWSDAMNNRASPDFSRRYSSLSSRDAEDETSG